MLERNNTDTYMERTVQNYTFTASMQALANYGLGEKVAPALR